nr:MAG TPA: hypothetical protein [Caudoviricetes sp.]
MPHPRWGKSYRGTRVSAQVGRNPDHIEEVDKVDNKC